MSVAIRAITRIQDADDVNVTPAVGVDEYALVYDHDTARFVLRAPAAPFAGILATGATVGATAQAQAFTLGVVSPFIAPAADGTAAWQVRKADKATAVVTVDTTNARVGIGTTAPGAPLHVVGNGTYAAAFMSGFVGHGTTAPEAPLHITNNATIADGVKMYNGGTLTAGVNIYNGNVLTYGFYVANEQKNYFSGKLGIGTTTPASRLDIDAGALTMAEMTAPTGVADKAMLYTKDTGGGKTALCVKLGDDVEIVLATQA